MDKVNIAQYLISRLSELGIKDVFGVPGDYNLTFLDQIVNTGIVRWVGNCNELNAAYAADGYARVKGAAAVVTTFGVGELSAINGIAGSYSEYLPVVHIVGAPATTTQQQGAIMHHTFGTGDFEVFIKMYEKVAAAVAIINNPERAAQEIDLVLETCWIKKQPVYISLPANMVDVQIARPEKPLQLNYPASNPDAVDECVQRIAKIIREATSPVFVADICAVRHHMKPMIQALLDQTGVPFATMNMGKGIINESHPSFMGFYNGRYSTPGVQERIEHSDCIISFGTVLSDINTGGFTSQIDARATIEIHSDHVKIHHALYPKLYFNAVLPALCKALTNWHHRESIHHLSTPDYSPTDAPLTQKRFWAFVANYLQKDDIIIAETGTSMFGLLETVIPDNVTFIAQCLWGSIGYATGAVLGAAMAAPSRRTLLFTGDGSFQLTAQELSTVVRHQLNPIVFLINNNGYTIERVIHGATMVYNDIQPWQYASLPAVFGDRVFTVKVKTEHELADALREVETHRDKLCFIELVMNQDDCPDTLRRIGESFESRNKS